MPMRLSLRRMFRRDFPHTTAEMVPTPGDRFRERGGAAALWEVERVLFARSGGAGHVVLRDPERRRPRRLVSQATLADLQRFAPLDSGAYSDDVTAA